MCTAMRREPCAACGAARGAGGGGGDARRRFLLPPPPLHSASGIGGSPARRPPGMPELATWRAALRAFPGGGVFFRPSPKARRRPAALSPCPILFCGTQSASPARAFFDGRRPARADPRQAGRRRRAAEPDWFDQAVFDAPRSSLLMAPALSGPALDRAAFAARIGGSAALPLGVRERGYRLRRPGLPSAAGGPVRVRYPALPPAAMILPASSHSLQDPSTFRRWRGRMPPWRRTARSRRV